MKIRKQNAKHYTELLKKYNKRHVASELYNNHGFLKYPILVKDRDLFLNLAEKNRIELGDWFISPLHPIVGDLTPWKFETKLFPVATFVSQHIVNLPTNPANIDRVLAFVEDNIEYIQ